MNLWSNKRQRSSEFGFLPSWCSPYTWGTLFRQLFAEIMFRTFGRASDCFVPFSAFAVRGSELSDQTYNFYEYMNEDANATDYVSGQSTFWLSWSSFVVTLLSRATFLLLSLLLLVLIWLSQISARRLALCIIHVFFCSAFLVHNTEAQSKLVGETIYAVPLWTEIKRIIYINIF